eukprot:Rmarinus@m.10221
MTHNDDFYHGEGFQVEVLRTLKCTFPIHGLDVLVETNLVAGCGGMACFVWFLNTFRIYHQFGRVNKRVVHKADLNGCRFSPDGGILATFGVDRQVVLWSVMSKKTTSSAIGAYSRSVFCSI